MIGGSKAKAEETADTPAPDPALLQPPEAKRSSCWQHFEALWLCYSPSYQIGVYYREGELEDCSRRFNNVISCLQLQTQYAHRVNPEELKLHHPCKQWEYHQTKEETAAKWQRDFGALLYPRQGDAARSTDTFPTSASAVKTQDSSREALSRRSQGDTPPSRQQGWISRVFE